MRPPINPGKVTWAGDHLLLALRPAQASEDTTLISLYRTLYSPEGVGYSLLALADVGADGWGADDVRAIYTDNPALTEWVRIHLIRRPNHPFRDPTLPVREARFESGGAVGQTLQYVVHTPETILAFTWADFETPFYLEAPKGVIGADYDIFSLICAARTGQVRIGDRRAAGEPYPSEVWRKSTGQPRSSALVALCEVLVDLV